MIEDSEISAYQDRYICKKIYFFLFKKEKHQKHLHMQNFKPIMTDIYKKKGNIIDRPGVAGAVLQTALSLIDSLTHSLFVEISLRRRHALMVLSVIK